MIEFDKLFWALHISISASIMGLTYHFLLMFSLQLCALDWTMLYGEHSLFLRKLPKEQNQGRRFVSVFDSTLPFTLFQPELLSVALMRPIIGHNCSM